MRAIGWLARHACARRASSPPHLPSSSRGSSRIGGRRGFAYCCVRVQHPTIKPRTPACTQACVAARRTDDAHYCTSARHLCGPLRIVETCAHISMSNAELQALIDIAARQARVRCCVHTLEPARLPCVACPATCLLRAIDPDVIGAAVVVIGAAL